MEYTVGQKVWFAPYSGHHGVACELTVTKVGRVWATLNDGRYRVARGLSAVDGDKRASPGALYASEEVYQEFIAVVTAWNGLKKAMGYYPPVGITRSDIAAAYVNLRLRP